MVSTGTLLCLSLSLLSAIIILILLYKDYSTSGIKVAFITFMLEVILCCSGQILQILLSDRFNIPLIIFDNITYVGTVFLPISLFAIGYILFKEKPVLKIYHLSLVIVPILSLIVLWTNNSHHLFYETYSIYIPETKFGPYFIIHSLYSYFFIGVGLIFLISSSIKNTGLFSKQSLLILFGTLIPVIANVFATFGIFKSTIYLTPITFSFAIICYFIAIYKFNFLNITPIALNLVVNTISDGYVVLNTENRIENYNKAFLDYFNLNTKQIKNVNLFNLNFVKNIKPTKLKKEIEKTAQKDTTFSYEVYFDDIKKYFEIEGSSIKKNTIFIGTLLLFKDITQHKLDVETIKSNQEQLVEKERLASLGQMIGGIAHNLKTPIFSISGGLEGLTDLVNEYDSSIEDDTVTNEDMHAIAKDMYEWIDKLKNHISYMSDIITAVKGQAVALSENNVETFSIDEVFKYVNILMKHELQNSSTKLNSQNNVSDKIKIHGNINGLVQVINNLISNAIDVYNDGNINNREIDFSSELIDDKIVFKIKDYGTGLPKEIKDKIFKEMVTTKGKNGTGLGLFMSYSNIKSHFSGNLYFETKENIGTTFFIEIPYLK